MSGRSSRSTRRRPGRSARPVRTSASASPRRRARRGGSQRALRRPNPRWSWAAARCGGGSRASHSTSERPWRASSGRGCVPSATRRPRSTLWRTNFQPLLAPARASAQSSPRPGDARRAGRPGQRSKAGSRAGKAPARAGTATDRADVARARDRQPTPRVGLPNGLKPDTRLWVATDGAREPGVLFTAVGPLAARVAVIRDGRAALRLLPTADLTPRSDARRADRALATFLAIELPRDRCWLAHVIPPSCSCAAGGRSSPSARLCDRCSVKSQPRLSVTRASETPSHGRSGVRRATTRKVLEASNGSTPIASGGSGFSESPRLRRDARSRGSRPGSPQADARDDGVSTCISSTRIRSGS
jgi:hypothetical protein